MWRSVVSKVAWVGRTASMVFGLALVMALVLGVATTALSATGGNFILGKAKNAATKVTGLVGNVDGGAALRVTNPNGGANDTALDLRVQAGEAPMRVNSAARVANLNAATAGRADSAPISGYERVSNAGTFDSSAHKVLSVSCPEGKQVLGGGGQAFASLADTNRDRAPLTIRHNEPSFDNGGWIIIADETADYSHNWLIRVYALCANTAP